MPVSEESQKIINAIAKHFPNAEVVPRQHDAIISLPEDENSDFRFQILVGDIANPHVFISLKRDSNLGVTEEVLYQHEVGQEQLSEFLERLNQLRNDPSRLISSHGLLLTSLSFQTRRGDKWQAEITRSSLSLNPINIFRTHKVLGTNPKGTQA